MVVRTATARDATCFPNWYFRCMVVNYMVNKRQLIYTNKFVALMSLYGVKVEGGTGDRGWTPPLSYRQYLKLLLRWEFWGDEVVLYAISCMWSMKITAFNTKTMQEYRIRHNHMMDKVDVVITYNADNHFNVAGEYSLLQVVTCSGCLCGCISGHFDNSYWF